MPVPVSIKKNVGESGYADVRPGKKSVRVMFQSGTGYEVDFDQWTDDRPAGKYNVTMSSDGTKIIGVRPVEGTYILEFVAFGNRGNVDVPEQKIQHGGPRTGKDGKKWYQEDSLVFVAQVQVKSEGPYEGLSLYMNLPYIFSALPGGNTELKGRKGEIERTETFLRVNGFDLAANDIPYSGNVLPWLEKRLQEVAVPFLGTVDSKGWIKDPAPLPKELIPARKPKAKAKARK